MTNNPALDALTTVLKLGLIDEAQYNTAIQHPDIGAIHDCVVDPAYMLAWLVSYRIVPDESLQVFALRVLNHSSGQAFHEKSALFEAAEQHLQKIYVTKNSVFLKLLLDERLISQEEFDDTDPEFLDYKLFDSPADLYQWLFLDHYDDEELAAVRASVDADRPFITASERVAIFDAAVVLLAEEKRRQAKSRSRANLLLGAILLFPVAIVLVAVLLAWLRPDPPATLTCDSPEAISTVNSMLFRIQVQMRSDVLRGGNKLPAGKVGLHNPQELGYASAVPIRGCAGMAQFGETAFAFAYTIRPSDDDKDKHVVAGASMEIVKARFSQIDAAGNFANKAEPVGRGNLAQALRDGAARFSRNSTAYATAMRMRSRMQARRADGDRVPDPDIREVEPLGQCRVLEGDRRYACPVVFEWNDIFSSGFGKASYTVKQGEFTVEFNQWDDAWRVSEDFPKQYMKAISSLREEEQPEPVSKDKEK